MLWAAAVETLLSGGTSVAENRPEFTTGVPPVGGEFSKRVDHLVLIPEKEIETIAAAVRAYKEVGIRAFIAPLIQDQSLNQGMPTGELDLYYEPYFRGAAATLELIEQVVSQFHRPEEGISILVAPTEIQLCSDALFEGCS